MARLEHQRENLLRDAVAYRCRILLRLELAAVTLAAPQADRLELPAINLFAGMRAGGGWSLYFGEDPVLQFTAAKALRRLYMDGRKFSAVQGRLVELRRERLGGRVQLEHVQQSRAGEEDLLGRCLNLLRHARAAIEQGKYQCLGQVPPGDAAVQAQLVSMLESCSQHFSVALAGEIH